MTVYAVWQLYCNYYDPAGPLGMKWCHKSYVPPEDSPTARTPGALRKLAAKDGWTRVPQPPLGRSYDHDMCPEHKPQEGSDG